MAMQDAPAGARARWDAIAVTAPSQALANAVCSELRTAAGERCVLLAVADPSRSVKMGSGAATLNAVLAVGEELSAREGRSTLAVEPLRASRVLVLHAGAVARGGNPHPALPQALTALPVRGRSEAESESPGFSSARWTLHAVSRLFASMPGGLVIASMDSVLLLPPPTAADGWVSGRCPPRRVPATWPPRGRRATAA